MYDQNSINSFRSENEVKEDDYQGGSVVEDNFTGIGTSSSGGFVDSAVLESCHDKSAGPRPRIGPRNKKHRER